MVASLVVKALILLLKLGDAIIFLRLPVSSEYIAIPLR